MRHLWLPRIAYSRDGNGTFSLPEAAFTSGTSISSTAMNSNLSNIAAAITQSVSKDGQTTYTGNQPMAGFKFTGLGAGSSAQDSVRVDQLAGGTFNYAADSGSSDAYAITLSPAISAYAVGQMFIFKAGFENSDADPTLAVNGLTAGIIYWPDGSSLCEGDIPDNALVQVIVASVTTGTPTFHLQTGRREETGTVKGMRGKSTQLFKGWVIENGGTIGDASSGATRAKKDCKALFKYLWENSNYSIQDSSGSAKTKGADSDTDWAAHCRLVLSSTADKYRRGNATSGGATGGSTSLQSGTTSGALSVSVSGSFSGTTDQSGDFRGKTDGGTASSNNTHTHNFSGSVSSSGSTSGALSVSGTVTPPYVYEITIIKL